MRLFKRLKEVEAAVASALDMLAKLTGKLVEATKQINKVRSNVAAMRLELKRLKKENDELREMLENIEKKLPDYEEAIAKGVDDIWNKAVQEIVDYNPMTQLKKENSIE